MITCDLMVLRRVELALRPGPMESALERSYTDGLKRGKEREREREREILSMPDMQQLQDDQ